MKNFLSLFKPNYAQAIVYMLQSTEYQVEPYLRWFWRTNNFDTIMYRRTLAKTKVAKLLLAALSIGMLIEYVFGIILALHAYHILNGPLSLVALAVFLATPLVWAHLIIVPLVLGRWFLVKPKHSLAVSQSQKTFASHKAIKIAVAGSYGKTTMKEMLFTVLSEGKKVAATPANKNVAISHANFAQSLTGDEEVLIIEYGEGAPGDVAKFTKTTKPDMAIVTGLAPAHLDKYKTLQKAGEDIFSVANSLKPADVFVNEESVAAKPFIKPGFNFYNSVNVAGWQLSNIKVGLQGTSFEMKKARKNFKIESQLLGRHQVGPVAVAVIIADKLGLTKAQIEQGISKIQPFEHRMEARQLNGAWLLDDTYNGNIDGMKAGLKLLQDLKATRKIYVTPGLVDQGKESAAIHQELGKAIATAKPDMVVLMQHSVTADIQKGIIDGGYKGQLIIEEDPLNFYTHLDMFVAAGDLVMMQNDWPDNYN